TRATHGEEIEVAEARVHERRGVVRSGPEAREAQRLDEEHVAREHFQNFRTDLDELWGERARVEPGGPHDPETCGPHLGKRSRERGLVLTARHVGPNARV